MMAASSVGLMGGAGPCHTLLFLSLPSLNVRFFRSQSRMRGDYLFYEEKIEITPEERDAKAARR